MQTEKSRPVNGSTTREHARAATSPDHTQKKKRNPKRSATVRTSTDTRARARRIDADCAAEARGSKARPATQHSNRASEHAQTPRERRPIQHEIRSILPRKNAKRKRSTTVHRRRRSGRRNSPEMQAGKPGGSEGIWRPASERASERLKWRILVKITRSCCRLGDSYLYICERRAARFR